MMGENTRPSGTNGAEPPGVVFRATGRHTLAELAFTIVSTGEGARNHTLHEAACLAYENGYPLEAALAAFRPAGLAAGLPLTEVTATTRSAYRRTMAGKPRIVDDAYYEQPEPTEYARLLALYPSNLDRTMTHFPEIQTAWEALTPEEQADHKREAARANLKRQQEQVAAAQLPLPPVAPSGIVNVVDYLAAIPSQIPWLVSPLIYQGGVTLISGPPKAGKSTLAAQIQRCSETGDLFLDAVVIPGPVLLVTEEGGVAVGWKVAGLTDLDIYDRRASAGETFEATLTKISVWCDAHPRAVVFIDTLSIWAGISDENDASKVTAAVALVMRLAQEQDVAVVLVHHSRKTGGTHGEAIRGSGAILATVDISVELKRTSEDSDDRWLDVQGRVIFPQRMKLTFSEKTHEYTRIDSASEPFDEAQLDGIPSDGPGMTRAAIGRLWEMTNPRKKIANIIEIGRMRGAFAQVNGKGMDQWRYWSIPPAGQRWHGAEDDDE